MDTAACPVCLFLTFGSLIESLGAFGLDHERHILGPALVGVGLASVELGLFWLITTGLYPYTWRLAPS
jgi:hypothetical protein